MTKAVKSTADVKNAPHTFMRSTDDYLFFWKKPSLWESSQNQGQQIEVLRSRSRRESSAKRHGLVKTMFLGRTNILLVVLRTKWSLFTEGKFDYLISTNVWQNQMPDETIIELPFPFFTSISSHSIDSAIVREMNHVKDWQRGNVETIGVFEGDQRTRRRTRRSINKRAENICRLQAQSSLIEERKIL